MFKMVPSSLLAAGIAVGFYSAATITACAKQGSSAMSATNMDITLGVTSDQSNAVPTLDSDNDRSVNSLLSALEAERVVFVGETHDRYDHHLNQLAIIRGLHRRGVDIAVGMEFFQEPFQRHLDRYVAGEIGEKALLKQTEYYARWKYDYRLYRDILVYARENAIPLVALNAPTELVVRVSKGGLAGLEAEDRARLPEDLAPPGPAYEARLRPVFAGHGTLSEDRFRRFADVQLLWDEYMARVARDYLNTNPEKTMVILAGSGHVAHADAIPGRLARMTGLEHAVVVTGFDGRYAGGSVDFRFAERDIALEPPGRTGLMLTSGEAGVTVREVRSKSPAEKAGFQPGDRIVGIAGEPVRGMDDVRLALLDRMPGEAVWVELDPGGKRQSVARQGKALTLL